MLRNAQNQGKLASQPNIRNSLEEGDIDEDDEVNLILNNDDDSTQNQLSAVVTLEADSAELRSGPSDGSSASPDVQNDHAKKFSENVGRAGEGLASTVPDEAPDPCNTGASIRHEDSETGGIDTLEASIYGHWDESRWPRIKENFDRARTAAEELADGGSIIVTNEGDRVQVLPAGQKHGVYCRWVMEYEGWTIAIVQRQHESETTISAWVSIGSVKLMDDGAWWSYVRLKGVLKALGFNLSRFVPSRVDMCADLPGVDVRDFVRAMWEDHAICRARKGSLHWDGVPGIQSATGFSIGTGIHLRVYEKLKECVNDPEKLAILKARRWLGTPECATRVEFQLRRDTLRDDWHIESMEDLFKLLGKISQWLTHDWFRLVQSFDRKNRNHERSEVMDIWKKVQAAFAAWTGQPQDVKPRRRRWVPDYSQTMKQAFGCLAKAAAGTKRGVESATELQQLLYEYVEDWADDAFERYGRKTMELAFSGRMPDGEPDTPF